MADSKRVSRPSGHRLVYGTVAACYVLLFAALIWPVYPRFATIEPRVLQMPHSMAYVVGGLMVSFTVLLGLYLWEESKDSSDDQEDD